MYLGAEFIEIALVRKRNKIMLQAQTVREITKLKEKELIKAKKPLIDKILSKIENEIKSASEIGNYCVIVNISGYEFEENIQVLNEVHRILKEEFGYNSNHNLALNDSYSFLVSW